MVGSRYDNNTQDQERDIYVVKVDSNGLITWTKEIPTDKQETSIYPNPGTSQLNIKTKGNLKDFELLNINGQVVIREMLDKNNSIINVESIKPGIYFYRLVDKKNKTVETGKWIKH
jgi:ABC-type metal ion transport system substrate-binding protein